MDRNLKIFILFVSLFALGFSSLWAQSEGNAVTFDGTNDYITFTAQDTFDIESNFTIEAWVYLDDVATGHTIVSKRDIGAAQPNTNYSLRVDPGTGGMGRLRFFWYNPALVDCFEPAPGSISTNTWHHVAATYDTTTNEAVLYVDGVEVNSTTMSADPVANNYPFVIGARYNSGAYDGDFAGDIDELRISNIVRYPSNYTVPTEPFLSDSNTIAIFHFDKAAGQTTAENFIASMANPDGTLQNDADFTTSAPSMFNTANNALRFDGSDDYFSGGDSSALDITGSITLEAWIKPEAVLGSSTIISKWDTTSANRSYLLGIENGKLIFKVSSDGTSEDTVASVSTLYSDRWYHVAGVYDGASLDVFINGNLDSSYTYSGGIFSSGAELQTGAANGVKLFQGMIDEIRISDNARYTTSFSTPLENLITDSNTALLVHAFHSSYEIVAKDASGNNVDLQSQNGAYFYAANYFDVALSEGDNNPGNSNEAANGQNIPMVQFKIDASNTDEDIDLNSVRVIASGTADDLTDIALNGVLLYRDINENGIYDNGIDQYINLSSGFDSNDGIATINTSGYTITQGEIESFLILYNLANSASPGETFIASISSSGIDLQGATSGDDYTAIGDTVSGGTKTINFSGFLTINEGVNNPADQNVANSASNFEVLQIQLSASSAADVTIDSLKISASGSIDQDLDISTVDLYHDLNDNGLYDSGVDSAVVTGAIYAADDTLVFQNISKTIFAGTSQNWLILYNLNGSATNAETFAAQIVDNASVYTNASVSGAPVNSATFTISDVGELTLSEGSLNPGNSNEGVNAQDVVLMQFTLSANETEDVGISRIEFTASGTGNDNSDFLASLYHDVNSNGLYDIGTDNQFGSSGSYNSDNGTLIFNIEPNADTLIAGDSRNYILVYDFNGNATQDETYRANIVAGSITATGVTSSASVSVIGSSVQGGLKTIKNVGSLSLAFNNKPPSSSITADAQNAPIYQVALTASSTENIEVSSIIFEETGTATANTDILTNGIKLYRDINNNGQYDTGTDLYINSAERYGGFEVTFDGTGDYIALDANNSQIGGMTADGITVEAWVRISSSASATEHIIASVDRSEYWRLAVNGARRVFWATASSSGTINDMTGSAQLSYNTWYHVAAVYEPATGEKRIYLNGTLDNSIEPYTDGTLLGTGMTRYGFIGTGSEATTYNGTATPANYWHGEIDEFRISNTVRYALNFTAPTSQFIPDDNTAFLLHFNEGSGTNLTNAATSGSAGDAGLYGDADFANATKIIEDKVTILTTGQTIPAGTTRSWLLIYDLADSASNGETFQVRVASATDIVAEGENSTQVITPTGSFPLNGNAQTISNIGSITMNKGSNSPEGQQIPNNVMDMEMLQLLLTASSAESLLVQSITVKGSGSGDESVDVDSVFIALDLNSNGIYNAGVDQIISQKYAYPTNNGTIAISVNDTLPKAEGKNYLIIYDYDGSASDNETFAASVDLNSYIQAQGLASSSSANISGAPVTGGTMTINNAPELTLSPGDDNPVAGNIVNNAIDIEMIQFNLAASAKENINITSIKFIDIGNGDESTAIDSAHVRLYRDVNHNGTLETLTDNLLATGGLFLDGDPGNAVSFDGSNDYINIPDDNNLDITGDLTIEAWIYPSQSSGGTYTVVAKRDYGAGGTPTNYSLRVDNYRMRFFFYSPNGSLRDCFDATQRIFPGSWYHIAGVYDATINQMRLYVNGALVQTSNIGDNDPVANNYPINIGRRYWTGASGGGDSYFNGVIDEIRLSDAVRYTGGSFSVSQIPFQADANTRLLVHFNDNPSSSTVADSSGNGLDGTLTNGATLVESSAPLFGGMTVPLSSVSISAGTSEDWLIVYDFNGTANQNETFQSRVLRPVDIQATGAVSAQNAELSGLPVTGGEKTINIVGNLTVDIGDNNPPASNIATDAQDVVMMQFKLTASNVENINISSIAFNAQGTGHDVTDISLSSIRLYQDINNNGAYDSGTDAFINQGASFDGDNGNITISTTGQTVNAGAAENWILLYSFSDSASYSETFFSRIVQNTGVVAIGATSDSSIVPGSVTFPVTGNIKTVSSTGSVTLSEGSSNPLNGNISNNEQSVEMLQLQLAASSAETLKVAQIQLKSSGSGDDATDIDSIYIYHDLNNNGEFNSGVDTLLISSSPYSADNGTVTMTFSDSLVFAAGETQNWLIVYDMAATAVNGETFQVTIELSNYLTGKGAVSGQPFTVSGNFPISGAVKTISDIGTLTLSLGTNNPGASTVAKNEINIEMMQMHLSASAAESLAVSTVTFTALGNINDVTDLTFVNLYHDVNSNGVLDLTVDTKLDTARQYNADNGTVTFTLNDTLLPAEERDWLVLYNLSSSASAGETFRVRLGTGGIVASGIQSAGAATIQGLPLTSSEKTVTDVGNLTLSVGTANPGSSNITADAQDLEVLQFSLTASSVEDVNVNSVTIRHSGTADPVSDITENHIDLYLDDGDGVFESGIDTYIGTGSKYANYGVNFDGTNDYVALNANDSQIGGKTSSGLTVEAWIKLSPSASAGEHIIVTLDYSEYWRFRINNYRLGWGTNSSEGRSFLTSSTVLSTDTWYHVAAVYQPSTGARRIYLDGNLVASDEPYSDGTVLGDPGSLTRYAMVGINSEAAVFNGNATLSGLFYGEIDEVRISNTVRYNSNFTKPTEEFTSDANTMVLHHFAEGTGSTTTNSATQGGAGNAILNNGATFVEATALPPQTVTITTPGQVVSAGNSEEWLLVYDLSDSASTGETFIASLLQRSIVATGATSGSNIIPGGENVSGGVKTVAQVGDLTVSAGANNPDASTESADATGLAMMQLQLEASSAESLLVSAFQVKGQGTANEQSDVDSVYLYRDENGNGTLDLGVDVQISTSKTFGSDNGVITWTFSPAETLAAGSTVNWLVVYDLADSSSNAETMQARIELSSYFTVTGLTTSQSITPSGSFPVVGGVKTISNIGRLQISLGSNTPAAGSVGIDADDVEVVQFRFVTNSAESLRVDSLHLTPMGTLNHSSGIASARLYHDTDSDGNLDLVGDNQLATATFSDSLGTLVFNLSDTLAPSSTKNYLVVYNLSGSGALGQTFRLRIAADSDVFTTGLAGSPHSGTVIGSPVESNQMTLSGKGTLSVQPGPANPGPSNEPNNALNLPMVQVRFTAGNVEDININSITFTAAGTAHDVTDISANGIKLYNDVNNNGIYDSGTDQFIGQANSYSADNGSAMITTTGQTIVKGTSVNWLLVYDLNAGASAGETFIARFLQASNISAIGVVSDSAITPSGTMPVVGGTKTISATGSITLSAGSNNPSNSNINNDDSDVELLQLQLVASSAETLLVNQVQFKSSGTGADQTDISGVTVYHDLNNNGNFDSGVDTALTSSGTFSADNGVITFNFSGPLEIPAGATQNWLVVYDMAGSATDGETFIVTVELPSYMTVTGKSSGNPITPGGSFAISGATKTITSIGVLTVTAGTNNPGAGTEAKNANNIEMLQLHLAASAAESLAVGNVTFTALGTIQDVQDISFVNLYRDINSNGLLDLTIDERIDSSRTYSSDNGTVTFTINDTLLPSAEEDWLVIYNLADSASAGETFRVRLATGNLIVNGVESSNPATVQGLPITSAQKTITDVGAVTLSTGSNNPAGSNITANTQDLEMLQFRLSASSVEDVNINSVTFRHSGTADPTADILTDHIDLYLDDGDGVFESGTDTYIGTGSKYTNYGITMDGTDDYVALDANDDQIGGKTSSGITVEAWVKLDASANNGEHIIVTLDYSEYWRFRINNYRLGWGTNSSEGASWLNGSTVLATDTWYHVAAVYQPSTGRRFIFINGNLEASDEPYSDGTVLGDPGSLTRYAMIGINSEASTFNGNVTMSGLFHGEIDEVRISNTVRYTSGFSKPTDAFSVDGNTMVLHHFSEGTGTTTTNSATSGGAGNAVFNNETSFTENTALPGNTVSISTLGQVIPAGESENWLLVYDLADSASIGETFIASIMRTGIVATGATSLSNLVPGGNNVSGGTMTVSTFGTLSMANGSNTPPASNVSPGDINSVMHQVLLTASSAETLRVTQLQVKASGTGNDANDIVSAALYLDTDNNGLLNTGVDDVLSSGQTYASDNAVLTFTISDTIPSGMSHNYLVVYNFNDPLTNNLTYRTGIELNSYVLAENLSGASRTVTGAAIYSSYKTVSNVGQITLQIGSSNPDASNYASAATNAEVMQLLLTASSAESLSVSQIILTGSGTLNELTDISAVKLYRDVNNNGVLNLATDIQLGTNQTFSADNGTVTFSLAQPETLLASSTTNWLVVYDLNGSATSGETFRIGFANNSNLSVTGIETSQNAAVLGAPFQSNYMTVQNVGSVTITAGLNNPGPSNETANATDLEMLQIRITASSVENVRIDSLRLSAAGTANDITDILNNGVRLYLDVNNDGIYQSGTDNLIGSAGNYNANNGYFMVNTGGEVINQDASENWLLVYDLSGTASTGETFIGRLLQSEDVWATGVSSDSVVDVLVDGTAMRILEENDKDKIKDLDLRKSGSGRDGREFVSKEDMLISLKNTSSRKDLAGITSTEEGVRGPGDSPIVGGTKTISNVGSLALSLGSNNPPALSVGTGDTLLAVIQVALSAGNPENVNISSIRFVASGTIHDVTDITSLRLFNDINADGLVNGSDTQIGATGTYSGDNGNVTFSGLSETITAGTTENWLLVYNLAGSASNNETFAARIALNSHVTATGATTSQSITPSGAPVTGNTHTISNNGTLTLSLGTNNPTASNEDANATNVSMIQVNLAVNSVENITINSINFSGYGTGDESSEVSAVRLYRDVNNNGHYDSGTDTQIGSTQTFTTNNDTVTFSGINQMITANSNQNWILVYDYTSATNGNTFRVHFENNTFVTITGSSGSPSAIGAPFNGNYKTISTTGTLTLAEGANNPSPESLDRSSVNVEALQISLTTSSVEGVNISELVITDQGSGDAINDIISEGVKLIRDINNNGNYDVGTDNLLADSSFLAGDTVLFSLSGVTIPADSTENWLVVYDFDGTGYHGSSFQARLQSTSRVTAVGAISSNSITAGGSLPLVGGTKTITAFSALSVAGTDISASPLPGDENVGLMQLILDVTQNISTIYSIRVDNRADLGSEDAGDIDSVKIFQEDGTNPGFQPGEDVLIGGESITDDSQGGYAIVTFFSDLNITTASDTIYIAYDISLSANQTNSIGVLINSSSYFSVKMPETTLNDGDFPIQSLQDYSLPVQLISFNGTSQPGSNRIAWSVASSINSLGFIIQRQETGNEAGFIDITSYETNPALLGQGNSPVEANYEWVDNKVEANKEYGYRLVEVSINGVSQIISNVISIVALDGLPKDFALKQNYPNPFNPETKIEFWLPNNSKVSVIIYDILGHKITELLNNKDYQAGKWTVTWNGRDDRGNNVATGVYFYRISAGKFSNIKKMMLIK